RRRAVFRHRRRPVEHLLRDSEDSEIATQLRWNARAGGGSNRKTLRSKPLAIENNIMTPAAGRGVAGEAPTADNDIVVKAYLPDHPRRVVDAERQAVIVAQLRIAVAGPRRIAVEHSAKDGDLVRNLSLDPNPRHRDRRRRAAGRKIAGLDR